MVCESVPQPQWWCAEDKAKICQTVILPLHATSHRREMNRYGVFFSRVHFLSRTQSPKLNISTEMLQQIPYVSAKEPSDFGLLRVYYHLLHSQHRLSLLSQDPHDAGTSQAWLGGARGPGGPQCYKNTSGKSVPLSERLVHPMNGTWVTTGQTLEVKSGPDCKLFHLCLRLQKAFFAQEPRPLLLLSPLSRKRKKNKFRKRLPRASASWREPLPDKNPNQTVVFLCEP